MNIPVKFSGLASPMRERVRRLESELSKFPQVDCPVRNLFAPGVYAREMTIPAGVTATGAVHKTEHLSIVHGHCMVTTDDGVSEINGRTVFVSKPGAKRALHAITETVFLTIHPTDETDPQKLCELLTESKSDELIGGANNRQLLAKKEAACLGES